MKTFFLFALLLIIGFGATAQNVDLRRKISVSGSAEQEVTPDIINVIISLQEYMNGKTKVTINQLENQLETAVRDAGIPKGDFTVDNLYAYTNIYQQKKAPDFLASKQYMIKFHDLDKYNRILSGIDSKGVLSTAIQSYDYSKISTLRRELKIQALLAAKEKANYLVTSVGARLGSVIEITEAADGGMDKVLFANRAMQFSKSASDSDIDFKKIKLTFQVNAVFEIIP